VLERFSRQIRYEFVKKGEALYKLGSTRMDFFVILDGKASVLLPKKP
jgi:hypothetical protein